MQGNLMHFTDFSDIELLILNELCGEHLAKSGQLFYLVIFQVSLE